MGQTRRSNQGVLNLLQNPLGQKTYYDLISDRPVEEIRIRPNANITIAGGTSSGTLQNRGSALALIRGIEIEDGGKIVQRIDGRVLKIIAEMCAPRTLADFVRVPSGAAAGAADFYEGADMQFGAPIFAVPRELFYKAMTRAAGVSPKLRIGFETVPDVRAALFAGGMDRTVTLNSFVAEVMQHLDANDDTPPQFCPVYQQLAQQVVAGALADFSIPLSAQGDRVALLVIQFTAGDFEVSDILTNLQLISDQREIVGKTTDKALSTFEQLDFGGSFPIPGYHVFNFCDGGRWGNAIDPLKDTNLRLIVNVPGVSATAGQNLIRAWGMGLRTVPGVTKPAPATK